MRGVNAIANEIEKRSLKISVVGVPKTIDNDIPYVRDLLGLKQLRVSLVALFMLHILSLGFDRCIGLVKLMGRHSGYIANAALANGHANLCLVPEVPFDLDGEGGLFDLVEKRIESKGHALIVVAEGAGQYLFDHLEG